MKRRCYSRWNVWQAARMSIWKGLHERLSRAARQPSSVSQAATPFSQSRIALRRGGPVICPAFNSRPRHPLHILSTSSSLYRLEYVSFRFAVLRTRGNVRRVSQPWRIWLWTTLLLICRIVLGVFCRLFNICPIFLLFFFKKGGNFSFLLEILVLILKFKISLCDLSLFIDSRLNITWWY